MPFSGIKITTKDFDIYCDTSELQLGAAILQPVAYYSRKLNSAQHNYTVGLMEILSIVETLKEFCAMLYGCPNIHVFTDPNNNKFKHLQTQCVLQWCLFLDDYSVKFHYIRGNSNSLADMLSCLPFDEGQKTYTLPSHDYGYKLTIRVVTGSCQRVLNADLVHIWPTKNSEDTNGIYQLYGSVDHFQSLVLKNDLIDCFLHLPMSENIPFILTYANIAQAQPGDAQLQLLRAQKPNQYIQKLLAPNLSLWCYQKAQNQPWCIYLPREMLERAVKW
jgi:RNase H-like domain found in reverse transcriptase